MTAEQRAACGAAVRFELRTSDAIAGTAIPRIDDHNAPGAVGVGALPVNCTGGRRISTAIAYLEPARHRANLTIMAGRPVRQIVTRAGRADGVLLADADDVVAANEVIICGQYCPYPRMHQVSQHRGGMIARNHAARPRVQGA